MATEVTIDKEKLTWQKTNAEEARKTNNENNYTKLETRHTRTSSQQLSATLLSRKINKWLHNQFSILVLTSEASDLIRREFKMWCVKKKVSWEETFRHFVNNVTWDVIYTLRARTMANTIEQKVLGSSLSHTWFFKKEEIKNK